MGGGSEGGRRGPLRGTTRAPRGRRNPLLRVDRVDHAVLTEGLTKRFGHVTAVDHLSLRVRGGEVYGFLGPNGSGKTTTLRMLCGILIPTEGGGTVLGHDIVREPEQIKAAIGYMSQRF